MNLRPYQTEAKTSVYRALKEDDRVLLIMPTGAGKTIVFSKFAQDTVSVGKKALILVDQKELLKQAADKLRKSVGIEPAIEWGEGSASLGAQVVVATVQTLRNRLAKWPRDHFRLVVVDEAHRFATPLARKVIDHFCPPLPGTEVVLSTVDEEVELTSSEEQPVLFETVQSSQLPTAKLVGVTATPDTTGKKALSNIYARIAYEIPMLSLIEQGYLCKINVETIPIKIDLSGIAVTKGDYEVNALAEAVKPSLQAVANAMRARNRKWLVFMPTIASSKEFCDVLRGVGLDAVHVDGTSDDRDAILKRYDSAPNGSVLVNSALLSTGYDCPSISGIVNLRATKSKILYRQIVGRGTRPHESKDSLLILDILWHHEDHGLARKAGELARPSCLVSTNDEDAATMDARFMATGEEQLSLEGVAKDAEHARMMRLAAEMKKRSEREARKYSAFAFIAAHAEYDPAARAFIEHESTSRWEMQPVTDGQKSMLLKHKFSPEQIAGMDKGKASKAIEFLVERSRRGLATIGQMNALDKFHARYDKETITFEQASERLEALFNRR